MVENSLDIVLLEHYKKNVICDTYSEPGNKRPAGRKELALIAEGL